MMRSKHVFLLGTSNSIIANGYWQSLNKAEEIKVVGSVRVID